MSTNTGDTATSLCADYFGTRLNPCTFDQWLKHIAQALQQDKRAWLCGHHNLHSLALRHRDAAVRDFYARCNDCYIDGMPVRIVLRGFGVQTSPLQRFSLMDHFFDFLAHAQQHQWSVFYLGSEEAVVERAEAIIREHFPQLRIQLHHGYPTDSTTLVQRINTWEPDILLVGMGMPQQEQWILQYLDRLDVPVVTHAGATLDYYTGAQRRPPLWLSRLGFAGVYRLLHNPTRLWHRYFVEPWYLLAPTLRAWNRHRRTR